MTFKEKKKYYVDKFMSIFLSLPAPEQEMERVRVKVALRFAEAMRDHQQNVDRFERERHTAGRKRQMELIRDLEESAIELGVAKYQARFYGLKVDTAVVGAPPA